MTKNLRNRLPLFIITIVVSVLAFSPFALAGRAEGVEINRFDVQPRTVNVGQSLRFTLNATVYKTEFDRYCTVLPGGGLIGSDLFWTVGEILSDGRNLNFHPGTGSNIVTYSQLRQRFGSSGVARIDFSFSKAAVSRRGGDANTPEITDRKFYAEFGCNRATGKVEITRSALVPVTIGSGTGCGGPGQPACPPATPGEPQIFEFSLDNPLQATNILELIDIIATWLFNLAIPIAVVMIVYAGVTFLISRGDITKVTQAKKILLYAVVGLAIILIGKGFITLIVSILNLGGTP